MYYLWIKQRLHQAGEHWNNMTANSNSPTGQHMRLGDSAKLYFMLTSEDCDVKSTDASLQGKAARMHIVWLTKLLYDVVVKGSL